MRYDKRGIGESEKNETESTRVHQILCREFSASHSRDDDSSYLANVSLETYIDVSHYLHFAINDIGMAFFFAIAAKEVFESVLPGGPLASKKEAAMPVMATLGGMIAPALLYISGQCCSRDRMRSLLERNALPTP